MTVKLYSLTQDIVDSSLGPAELLQKAEEFSLLRSRFERLNRKDQIGLESRFGLEGDASLKAASIRIGKSRQTIINWANSGEKNLRKLMISSDE